MPKNKISEYSTTNSANTDIESINIDEGCPPSSINNAIRELMVHLKEFQTGSSGDPLTVAGGMFISGGGSANTLTVTGILTASGGTILSSTNTLSGSNIISGNINSSGTTNTFSGGNILSGTNTFSGTNIFSSDVTLNAQSDLRFADSDSSNWVAFQAPATVASNVTWTLPSADGSADQVLVTNGSGTLSFATSSGSNDGFKNRIINGDMRIDQRNAGASVTLTSVGVYTVDRWSGVEDTDGGMTAQQDTSAPTSFVNSLKFTTTTADATLAATQYASCFQKIEGTNVADLAWGSANAKTITISFWTRSSLTGTFGGAINNSGATRSYPFTYSISVADTWEQKFVTIAGDTSGTWLTTTGIGLQVVFGLGVGSTYSGTAGAWAGANYLSATGATSVIGTLNATWYITGVQLEVGSVATPFERRPYGTELALCQRYYWQCTDSLGFTTNANNAYRTPITMPVPMRAAPTLVSGATFTVGSGSAGTPLIFIGTGSPATVTAVWVYNSASNWSTGVAVSLNAGFTSEL